MQRFEIVLQRFELRWKPLHQAYVCVDSRSARSNNKKKRALQQLENWNNNKNQQVRLTIDILSCALICSTLRVRWLVTMTTTMKLYVMLSFQNISTCFFRWNLNQYVWFESSQFCCVFNKVLIVVTPCWTCWDELYVNSKERKTCSSWRVRLCTDSYRCGERRCFGTCWTTSSRQIG